MRARFGHAVQSRPERAFLFVHCVNLYDTVHVSRGPNLFELSLLYAVSHRCINRYTDMPGSVDTTYSPEEVAKATSRNIHTIYRNLRSGKLEGEKFGGEWVITDDALQEWLPAVKYREFFGTDGEA